MTVVRSPLAGQTRRGLALLVALALPLALLVPGIAGAEERKGLDRLTAEDNTGAAVAWSTHVYDEASDVLLGRDDSFADNLPSGLVQGVLDAPLLLTSSTALRAPVRSELDRLGAQTVHILGGTKAISSVVESSLRSEGYTVRRYSGASRIETAIAIARAHAASATSAILSRAFGTSGGDETGAWADALGAGAWAAEDAFPVLFSQSDTLTAATRTYLQSSAIRTVYVVGGTSAISDAVVSQIRALGLTVERVSGPNRFATAVEVAQERGFDDAGDATHVVLLEGQRSDAWAPGFAAAGFASNPKPVVLSNGNALPPETDTFLAGGSSATAVTAGPYVTEAAATAVANKLGLLKEAAVTLDATSFANSGDITGKVTPMDDVQSVSLSGPCVTAGAVTPNATTGAFSKAIAQNFTPGECVLTVTVTYKDNTTQQTPFTVTITGPAPNTPVTDAPELVSVAKANETEDYTLVRFSFDEPVAFAPVNEALVNLVRFDGAPLNPDAPDGDAVRPDPNDNKSLLASFPRNDYVIATAAAVQFGAVKDFSQKENPEGSRSLQSLSFAPGRTERPDLLSVTGVTDVNRGTSTDPEWVVRATFKFDVAATSLDANLYQLMQPGGTWREGDRVHEGDGTADHKVDFASDNNGLEFANEGAAETFAGEVRRAMVAAGAVEDIWSQPNIAQTVNHGSGTTTVPKITSVALLPSSHQVRFTFDDVLDNTDEDATGFFVYNYLGQPVNSTAATVETGNSTVLATFLDNSIDDQVTGAGMAVGAVDEGATEGAFQTIEAGSTRTHNAGATLAPDLESVLRTSSSTDDPFGGSEITKYTVTYRFDQAVAIIEADAGDPIGFWMYASNGEGTGFIVGECSVGATASTAKNVICVVEKNNDPILFEAVGEAVLFSVSGSAVRGTGVSTAYQNYPVAKVPTAS